MKRKMLIALMFLILLTGCNSEYNIEFSNNKIKEHIVIDIPNTDIPISNKEYEKYNIELDDQITPFIEKDQYPFMDNQDKKYTKKVEKKANMTEVTLNYNYSHDEFKYTKIYNQCFDEKEFKENKKDYQINFSGSFYCLYGDKMTINIKTNNEVISHNADKVSGNVYTWIINDDNVKNTNISINISKKSAYLKPVGYIVTGVLLVVVLVAGYVVYKKIKNRDLVNEI